MTKSLHKVQKPTLQQQQKDDVYYFVVLINPLCILETKKVSRGFREVILKCTARQNEHLQTDGKPSFEVGLRRSRGALNRLCQRSGRLETENDAVMCESIVHVYRYTVFLLHTVTFQLRLFYILHRRLGFSHHAPGGVLCFLQLYVFFKSPPPRFCW